MAVRWSIPYFEREFSSSGSRLGLKIEAETTNLTTSFENRLLMLEVRASIYGMATLV